MGSLFPNLQRVRSHFPSLKRDELFMDNAAGAQVIAACTNSIQEFFRHSNANLGARFSVSKDATSKVKAGYDAVAAYINASSDEVVFGASTTQIVRNVSTALKFQPGDNIVLSKLDHEAHLAGWVQAAQWEGVEIRFWTPSKNTKFNPKLEASDLEAQHLIDDKTRLVGFTHVSNVLGSIADVAAITRTIKRINPKALVSVDAVAYAPHAAIDVKAFGVDFYFFSWYKVYGPHIATGYVKKATLAQLESLGHYFLPPDSANNMLGLACGNFEFIQAIPTVTAYLAEVGWDFITQQEEALQTVLLEYIQTRPEIQLFGEPSGDRNLRVPVISFKVAGHSSHQFIDLIYTKSKCMPNVGHFYATRLLDDVLQVDRHDGVIRCSFLHYNTIEEVYALTEILEELLGKGQ